MITGLLGFVFQSTRPARGGTWDVAQGFNHFNPPAPRGAGPAASCGLLRPPADFNPPAPRGAGRYRDDTDSARTHISIHPPREGRDGNKHKCRWTELQISIHPPREGRDVDAFDPCPQLIISIHPPREGRDYRRIFDTPPRKDISIHPPREGRDVLTCPEKLPSRWISIHPPREGRDPWRSRNRATSPDFNPPAPRGAGLNVGDPPSRSCRISIHPPREGRDCSHHLTELCRPISIHPPREGRDPVWAQRRSTSFQFQSTRPARGGTVRPGA